VGNHSLCSKYKCNNNYSSCDNNNGFTMNIKILQGFSLVITVIAILYLLFASLNRNTFVISDWLVVAFDLSAKLIVELILLFKQRETKKIT